MKDYITRREECPFCGAALNRVVDPWESPKRGPQPGDLTICLSCETTLVWNPQMRLALYDETNTEPQTRDQLAYLRWLVDKIKQQDKEDNL